MIAVSENGHYHPGQTLLHRLDPRVKILSCLLLVILTFAAPGWPKLFPLIVAVALAVYLTIPQATSIWRICWMFRWLLLFTLLMHLLFSSGRTLWGQSWLSRDGLLLGCFVCAQMLIAIVISALLAITTTTNTFSGTLGWFVRPLQRLGCETGEWQKILLLTMDFIPVVQEEMFACSTTDVGSLAESSLKSRTRRWSMWRQKLHGLLERLIDRGDTVAHRIAGDQDSLCLSAGLPPLMPMALQDQLFSLAITLVIACYWLAG